MKNYIKNKISKGLLIMATGTVVLTGCSDDFLNPDPLSFFEPEETLNTESGLRAALAHCDRTLGYYWTGLDRNWNNVPFSTEMLFSDMAVYGKTDMGGGLFDNINFKLTPQGPFDTGGDGSWLGFYWKELYMGVKYANTILTYVDQVEDLDEATKNLYKGRAYFHRSWRYMKLVFQFGDVPLVTKIPATPKKDYRSTKKEAILQMITEQMEQAVEWVPEQADMSHIGMVNKGACRMLLAKCYLATGQFAKAEEQTNILINGGYSLMNEPFGEFNPGGEAKTWSITRNVIWDMHRPENKLISANKEVIMGMPNMATEAFMNFNTVRVFGPSWDNNNLKSPDGKRAINNLARNNGDYIAELDYARAVGRGIGVSSPTYFAQHTLWNVNGVEDKEDLRHNSEVGNWVNMEDMKYNNKESAYHGQNLRLYNDEGEILCLDTIRCWYDVPLYKMWLLDVSAEANTGSNNFVGANGAGANANWYLYRLAEAYLLRAEARFYQGKVAEATADVNEIRKRAKCSQLYTTVTIGDIMNERARELYLEEWRNVELTRVSYCLALSGKPDEWGNTYDINTWDKQEGTDANGGSYWYQRLMHYTPYNKGEIHLGSGVTLNYTMNKKNVYWPIPYKLAIEPNNEGKLAQNFGYDGYDPATPMWENWQDAVADEESK